MTTWTTKLFRILNIARMLLLQSPVHILLWERIRSPRYWLWARPNALAGILPLKLYIEAVSQKPPIRVQRKD